MWVGIIMSGSVGLLGGMVAGYWFGRQDARESMTAMREWAQEAVETTKRMLATQPCAACGAKPLDHAKELA